jgi:hypothetical protein
MARVGDKPVAAPVLNPQTRTSAQGGTAKTEDGPKGWGPKPITQRNSAFVPSAVDAKLDQVKQLLQGHTDRNEEKQILEIFRGASREDLNGMINKMPQHDFHELVSDMNDRWIGPDNRTAFLNLLSKDRLGELSVDSRAKVISGLQYHRTDSKDEKAIRDIFVGTRGADLTALKNAVDSGGDYRDLQQLVFHDIDDKQIRSQVLEHFKKEGAGTGQVKVLSDIDDTFYVNFKDDRYPRKTVYPGVKQFYTELDRGGAASPDREGDLSFLSARPYDRAGLSEDMTQSMLQKNGVSATVMSGDFAHVVGNDLIAAKKFDNWQQSRQLFPEYGSVFTGDSGQGDAIFGAKAMAANDQMKAVFIHNVTGLSDAQKSDYAKKGVNIFDTYVGAATQAYQKGLISKEGLMRVANVAQSDLSKVEFSSPEQKAAREADLQRDLQAMQAALQQK